ncbi:Rieske (2Fe-2S) protein [Trichlorobacter ammonificans]|uniref:Ferredoxin reductase n=1 Tax=Trichlorobacter ammonificans TaxID=2916410 RepID=A0ABM9DAP2_9BACT|nr:Rieske (2Fe-2S) protein [Trichlorobacter ammonificans]CAH2032292.1 Ferredoxin reductase [Trichlorobacter ammonificans]
MPVVAKVGDIPNMGKKLVVVEGQELLLINHKGTVYAVETECPHQGAPLAGALVKESYLSCPRHGYRFELQDGSCREHPEYTLKTWPVRIENGEIIVDLA